jgi:hypothetical protein
MNAFPLQRKSQLENSNFCPLVFKESRFEKIPVRLCHSDLNPHSSVRLIKRAAQKRTVMQNALLQSGSRDLQRQLT